MILKDPLYGFINIDKPFDDLVETEYFRPKSDGKGFDRHTTPTRDQKVAEFVNEHDKRQNQQEHDAVVPNPAGQCRELFHSSSLSGALTSGAK